MHRVVVPVALASVAIVAMLFTSCGDDSDDPGVVVEADDLSWLDDLALAPLSGAGCTFVTTGTTAGTATVQLNATGEVVMIARRNVDSVILANGRPCGTATATSLKKLLLTGGIGSDTVIIDFINGSFGAGAAGGPGIVLDGGNGSDTFLFRGLPTADTLTMGAGLVANGLAANFGNDAFVDLTGVGFESGTIATGGGNDTVSLAGGNGTGAASGAGLPINGGDGDDTLTGGDGSDFLSGGAGNDTIRGSPGNDTENGGPGSDTFDEGALPNGNDTFNGGSDVLPAVGIDTVSYASRPSSIFVTIETSASGAVTPDDGQVGSGETDNIVDDVEVVTGSAFNDTLTCGSLNCTLNGGAGVDILTGGLGNDTLNGGAGNDTITGGLGDDVLNGDGDTDTFNEGNADSGSDTFSGGSGRDTINYSSRTLALVVTMADQTANDGESAAGEGDNVKNDVEGLIGGSGNDAFTGNDESNFFAGNSGSDVLSGGNGDDFFSEGNANSGPDVFNGGAGIDTIDYGQRTLALTVTMDGLAANDGQTGVEGDDIKSDVENINSGSAVDNITGNSGNNILDGAGGTDTINGGGGAGSDICIGASGDVVVPNTGCDL